MPQDAKDLIRIEDEFVQDHRKLILQENPDIGGVLNDQLVMKSVGLNSDRSKRENIIKQLAEKRNPCQRSIKAICWDGFRV